MKTLVQYALVVLGVTSMGILNFHCRKDSIDHTTIQLYDKPLQTIQNYLSGKWKFLYSKGGNFNLPPQFDTNDTYMMIDSSRIIFKNKNGILYDSVITWKKDRYNGADTFILFYYSSSAVPYLYVVIGIQDGILELKEDASDAMSYFFRKAN